MKFKILFSILGMILLFPSCDSLIEKDKSTILAEQYYLKESDLNGACVSIYPNLFNNQYIRLMNGIGCVGTILDSRYTSLTRGKATSDDSFVGNTWAYNYQNIARANYAIMNIERSALTDDIKNKYLAEAKALRAMLYLRLVKIWGDIPYRTTFESGNDDLPATPIKDVYLRIISDLRWAENYCQAEGWQKGRMDKIVVKTLLADAYITCASSAKFYNPSTSARALKPYFTAFSDSIIPYYNHVKVLTDQIINNSGNYKLLTTWTDLWGMAPTIGAVSAYDHRNNDEFIFSAQTIPGLYLAGHEYVPQSSEYAPAYVGGQFQTVAYEHVVSYNKGDLRYKEFIWEYANSTANASNNLYYYYYWRRDPANKDAIVAASGTISYNGRTYTKSTTLTMYPKKFYDKTYTTTSMGGAACVIPYYRMAEVYLMSAEAENELNGMTLLAVNRINPIRNRVGVPTYTVGQFSQDEFRSKIIDEYLWELCFEAKDYSVICRFGQLEERCKGVESSADGKVAAGMDPANPRPRTAENYWMPYPLVEKQLNKSLTQFRMSF
jgi:hypothetical protein